MRTKTLVIAAAVLAAGLASSMAQNVYSLNVVGYVNKSIPGGFSMIANPLNTTNNTLQGVISSAPNFSSFLKWSGTGFESSSFVFGNWTVNFTLAPGEGGFINPGATGFTNTFVGEVLQGELTNNIPAGFSIQASKVPQAGTATELGLSAGLQSFDGVLKWTGTGYESYSFVFGNWAPSTPSFDVGESFFVNAGGARTWVRTFNVE